MQSPRAGPKLRSGTVINLGLQSLYENGWANEDGFVCVDHCAPARPGEGNGLLQTGLALVIRAKNQGTGIKADLLSDKWRWEAMLSRCMRQPFCVLFRSPWKRNPDDNQDWDDYYGVLASCFHLSLPYPVAFLGHCKRFGWCVNVQEPEKWTLKYWFARSPGFVGFAKICGGEAPTRLNWLGIWAAQFVSCFTLASDACMRNYCYNSVVAERSSISRRINKFWFKRVRARYGTVGAAFSGYFKGMEHPLTKGDWN